MHRALRRSCITAWPCWNAGRAPMGCRRASHAAWRCQDRPGPTVDDSLPTFSYKVTAKQAASKLRLDAFLTAQVAADLAATPALAQDVSRAKIQASITAGLVSLNGRPASKASQALRAGDTVVCTLPPPPPLQAVPEAIPLDIKYEDEHLLVINKPAGMVVHVAPGHHTGTLVNALLHHCGLQPLDLEPTLPGGVAPAATAAAAASEDEDADEDGDCLDSDDDDGEVSGEVQEVGTERERRARAESGAAASTSTAPASGLPGASGALPGGAGPRGSSGAAAGAAGTSYGRGGSAATRILRPGIVHRLDRGTSGLLVVAKSEVALTRLQAQFKARTVDRLYVSLTVGCPAAQQGRVEANIQRDPRDRKRMAAAPYGSGKGRTAASGYTVESRLAGGGAALVRWKLDTGRTHQIRVHAKHIGHPLLGDETYGGAGPAAVAAVARGFSADQVRLCLETLGRPALHALTLGFTHPVSGERLAFAQPPPEDFVRALRLLGGEWNE